MKSIITRRRYLMQRLWLVVCRSGIARLFSDELFAKLLMQFWLGKNLDLKCPRDYNEKLQWLKIHYRNPLMPICADKYAVRKYVEEKIGPEYLNDCIGIYEDVEDIPYEKLPGRFVLKATHGSSWNIICSDKSCLDWTLAKAKMKRWLKIDFSKYGREWQYHEIKPRIICEEFLEDKLHAELMDYKLLTFNGETKYIWVDHKDLNGQPLRSFYNADWEFQKDKGHLYPNGNAKDVKRPECLAEMIALARKLSSGFPQCRVDFYVLENKRIVFGELTFSSANGCNPFYPQSFCDELGDCIVLPKDFIVE